MRLWLRPVVSSFPAKLAAFLAPCSDIRPFDSLPSHPHAALPCAAEGREKQLDCSQLIERSTSSPSVAQGSLAGRPRKRFASAPVVFQRWMGRANLRDRHGSRESLPLASLGAGCGVLNSHPLRSNPGALSPSFHSMFTFFHLGQAHQGRIEIDRYLHGGGMSVKLIADGEDYAMLSVNILGADLAAESFCSRPTARMRAYWSPSSPRASSRTSARNTPPPAHSRCAASSNALSPSPTNMPRAPPGA